MSFTMMNLPDEVISKILQSTDYESCRRLMFCCERLNYLVHRDQLFRRDDVNILAFMTYQCTFNDMLNMLLVTEQDKHGLDTDIIDAHTFYNEEFRTKETNERLAFNLSTVRSVKSLKFAHVTVDEEFLQVLLGSRFHLSDLRELIFISCDFVITEEQLKKIVCIPTLKCLEFAYCKFNFQFKNSTFSCWKSPQKLEIRNLKGVEFTDEFLSQHLNNPDFSLVLGKCETKFSLGAIIRFILSRSKCLVYNKTDFRVTEGSYINLINGLIRGKSVLSYGNQSGLAFLGIPYARPPLGKLRFKSPLPVSSWNGTLDGTKYKPACLSDPERTYKVKEGGPVSEDCLYLNVFTTSTCLKKGNCSVMAVIHGGAFKFESPTVYKEEIVVNNFANEDRNIVVVTLAFREGTLGWFNIAPGKNTSADTNISLRDNLASLEWIQQEIRYFGGNPQRVTLMGHSSGGTIVEVLSYLPASAGLFHQVISMSGFGYGDDYSPTGNHEYSKLFSIKIGCAEETETFMDLEKVEKIIECIRSNPEEDILSVQNSFKSEVEEIIGPWIDGSNGIFPLHQERLRKRRYPVNMLIGTLTGEMRDARRIMADKGERLLPSRLLEYCDHLSYELGYEKPEEFKKQCYDYYSKVNKTQMIDDDLTFYVHAIDIANSLVNKAKVYVYSYTYSLAGKAYQKFQSANSYGPNHAEDFIYIFGLHRLNFTAKDYKIEKIYTGMLANFISKGDPSYGGYSWKQWTTQEMNYFHIDFDKDLRMPGNKIAYYKEAYNFWRSTVPKHCGSTTSLPIFPKSVDSYSMRTVLLSIAAIVKNSSQTSKSLQSERDLYHKWTEFLPKLKLLREPERKSVQSINTIESTGFPWASVLLLSMFFVLFVVGGILCTGAYRRREYQSI